MLGVLLGLGLFATGNPVPAGPPQPPAARGVDRTAALQFADQVYRLAEQIRPMYAREVDLADLIEGAIRGLYEEAGRPAPDDLRRAVRRAAGATDLMNRLADARVAVGDPPALDGPRAFFAAVNGFKSALDPYCTLTTQRVNTFASVDMDFGIGVELEGATGTRWAAYFAEYGAATGRLPGFGPGIGGPAAPRDAVAPPVAPPWRVRRVIPGSPAQKAGVRPGDLITHVDGAELTAATNAKLFAGFAAAAFEYLGPGADGAAGPKRRLTLRRAGHPDPLTVTLARRAYLPETVFGVARLPDGGWDCMLDREYKIGYVRVGAIEYPQVGGGAGQGTDAVVEGMVDALVARGCRGLILDLRWCPGGYVTPGVGLASLFLPPGTVVSRMVYRDPNQGNTGDLRSTGPGRFKDLPLVVLVGSDTTGGGELIAAALQDAGAEREGVRVPRCTVIGQRTVGRAAIQTSVPFGGLMYKVTTGTSLRPSGRPRAKGPLSQPLDDWGVRPDPGHEVPVTRDVAEHLRRAAELHALRPADGTEALDFDDPDKDPFRVAALAHLRKTLGKP